MTMTNYTNKIMKTFLAAFAGIILITFVCCNNDDEEKNYTYSIKRIYWSDSLDSNQDGFSQFKRLHYIVELEENVTRTIVAEVYYRPKNASEFSFYGFSDFSRVEGGMVENDLSADIGFPNKELKRGVYDFKLELYEKNSSRLEAKSDSLQDDLMSNQRFDQSSRDKSYTLDISWGHIDDRDEDGYARNAVLLVDINVLDDVSKEVELYVYSKAEGDTTYTLYNSFKDIKITSSSPDDFTAVDIGTLHRELETNEYDFRLELFEKGSDILLQFIDEKLDLLNNRKFERQSEDSYEYTVANIFWSDTVDVDQDGFSHKRKLHFDINLDRDLTKELNAKIFFRHQDSSKYRVYDSTNTFSVKGSEKDDIIFQIGNANSKLDSSFYDVLVSAYEITEIDTQLAISFPIVEDTTLFNMQKFETESQDSL
jgi:hypothetical protein